jgi:hypothetical protein
MTTRTRIERLEQQAPNPSDPIATGDYWYTIRLDLGGTTNPLNRYQVYETSTGEPVDMTPELLAYIDRDRRDPRPRTLRLTLRTLNNDGGAKP